MPRDAQARSGCRSALPEIVIVDVNIILRCARREKQDDVGFRRPVLAFWYLHCEKYSIQSRCQHFEVCSARNTKSIYHSEHRLNMELDLHSLGSMCSAQLYSLAETPRPSPPPSPAFGLIYEGLLVSQDRRRLFVTPWGLSFALQERNLVDVSIPRSAAEKEK